MQRCIDIRYKHCELHRVKFIMTEKITCVWVKYVSIVSSNKSLNSEDKFFTIVSGWIYQMNSDLKIFLSNSCSFCWRNTSKEQTKDNFVKQALHGEFWIWNMRMFVNIVCSIAMHWNWNKKALISQGFPIAQNHRNFGTFWYLRYLEPPGLLERLKEIEEKKTTRHRPGPW